MQDSIEAALQRAGITADLLALKGAEGLQAYNTRVNFLAQHRFWRDLLMVKGYLGKDDNNTGGGGLIILAPNVQVCPGHLTTCQCSECVELWNQSCKGFLEVQQRRRDQLERELAEMSPRPSLPVAPAEVVVPEFEDDEPDDWSDREPRPGEIGG
jgi:hypothetical protein